MGILLDGVISQDRVSVIGQNHSGAILSDGIAFNKGGGIIANGQTRPRILAQIPPHFSLGLPHNPDAVGVVLDANIIADDRFCRSGNANPLSLAIFEGAVGNPRIPRLNPDPRTANGGIRHRDPSQLSVVFQENGNILSTVAGIDIAATGDFDTITFTRFRTDDGHLSRNRYRKSFAGSSTIRTRRKMNGTARCRFAQGMGKTFKRSRWVSRICIATRGRVDVKSRHDLTLLSRWEC